MESNVIFLIILLDLCLDITSSKQIIPDHPVSPPVWVDSFFLLIIALVTPYCNCLSFGLSIRLLAPCGMEIIFNICIETPLLIAGLGT